MQKGLLMRKNGYKTSVKRIAAGVLAAAMFLSFTACGGKGGKAVGITGSNRGTGAGGLGGYGHFI